MKKLQIQSKHELTHRRIRTQLLSQRETHAFSVTELSRDKIPGKTDINQLEQKIHF